MPSPAPIIEVRSLHKRFGEKKVLNGLDFNLLEGETLVILGRSGSGKSVALRQLNGLEKPDSGSVTFDGVEISALSERSLFPVRMRISMLFQGGALFDSMTVYENVAFPLREHSDLSQEQIREKVREKLAMVELEGVGDRYPAALSGGMKKRVALARSLAVSPEVVLYDEPTTGLDPITAATIARLIRSSQRNVGVSSVVVTHDLMLARNVADRIGFLDRGKFSFLGTWDEANRSEQPELKRFLEAREEVRRVA